MKKLITLLIALSVLLISNPTYAQPLTLDEGYNVYQSMWGFEGLDCLNLPGDPERPKNALWDVLNVEWEGNALATRYGYKEELTTAISGVSAIWGLYQLRITDTSKYLMIGASNWLYIKSGSTTVTAYHELTAEPTSSPGFATYKDLGILVTDKDVPKAFNPATDAVTDLITSYPSGYSASNFFPDTVAVCQTRLFMGMNKTIFWGPVDSYADWETSTGADDAGSQPLDSTGVITSIVAWHDSEVLIFTDKGEKFRLILGDGDMTGFYIKELPKGSGGMKDTVQPINNNLIIYTDKDGIQNLVQQEFAGNIRTIELSKSIRPIFSGGRLTNIPFRIHSTVHVNWRSINLKSRSQYWLAVSSNSQVDNNYVIVLDYSRVPFRITLFKFNDVIRSMTVGFDTTEKEVVYFGSNNGMIYTYGYEIFSDNDNAFEKRVELIVDFQDITRVDKMYAVMAHLVETGNYNINMEMEQDFSGVTEATTISCLDRSSVLSSTFVLGTSKLKRRELMHKKVSGWSLMGRVFRVKLTNTNDDEYFILMGIDFYGKQDRRIGDS